jgi:type IV pilus assembly protein PilP
MVTLVVVLGACGSPPPPPPAKPPPPPRPVVAAPEIAPPPAEVYNYSPIGKRDPFRSPIDDLIMSTNIENRCALCRWEVDQLHLVAVVTGTGSPVAMVEDPDGVGHVVRPGTQVGKHNGKVTNIGKADLLVVENSRDPFGKLIANKTILKIPHNPAENTQSTSLLDE